MTSYSPNEYGNILTPYLLNEDPRECRKRLLWVLMTRTEKLWKCIKLSYAAFRAFNSKMSNLIRRVYSQQRQHDFELAYILRVLYLVLFPLDAGGANSNAFVDPYRYLTPSWLLRRLSGTFRQTFIISHEGIGELLWVGYFERPYASRHNPDVAGLVVLYLLPIIVLLTFFVFELCARIIQRLGFSLPLTNFWSEIHFWVRQEITVLYLLLSLGMVFLIVVDVCFTVVRTMVMAIAEKEVREHGYKPDWFLKDALADQLYII